jgi:hypothetical protein
MRMRLALLAILASALAWGQPTSAPIVTTQQMLQERLDALAGTSGTPRWPLREGATLTNLGRITLTDTLVIDPGTIVSAGATLVTRGKGPRIDFAGTILVPDPNVDWTGKPVLAVAGTSVHLLNLSIQGSELSSFANPPEAGILHGVIAVPGTPPGHAYSGASSLYQGVEITGRYRKGSFVLNNGEMVTAVACDAQNAMPGGSAWIIARGGVGFTHGRIAEYGQTMTNVNIIGGRMSAPHSLVRTIGYVGQINVNGVILQGQAGGFAWVAEPDPAITTVQEVIQVAFTGNRYETHGAPVFAKVSAGLNLRNCAIIGNFLTLHSSTLPPNFLVVDTPTRLRPGQVEIARNDAWVPIVPWLAP